MNDRDSQCKKVIASLVRRREEIIDKALVRAHVLAMSKQREHAPEEHDEPNEAEIEEDCQSEGRDEEEEPRAISNSVAEIVT